MEEEITTTQDDVPETETPVTDDAPEPEREHHYVKPERPNRAIRRLLAKQARHARTRKERQMARIAGLLFCQRCGMPSLATTANRCQCKVKTNQQIKREEFIRLLQEQLQQGKISINDARSLLGMPPVEDVPVEATEGSEA